MFFIQLEKWHIEFGIFGDPKAAHSFDLSSNRLNTQYAVEYRSFQDLLYPPFQKQKPPTSLTEPPIHVVIDGKRMVGHVSVPPSMLLAENHSFADKSLTNLIVHYLTRAKENRPLSQSFEEWIEMLPIANHQKTLPAVLRTYEGEWILVWMSRNKLVSQTLTESSFVRNCKVTTLASLKEKQLDAARKKIESIKTQHAKLDQHEHELILFLDRDEMLDYVER